MAERGRARQLKTSEVGQLESSAVGEIETGFAVVTLMLTATFGPSQAPWLVWVAIGAIILVAVVGNLVSGLRTAVMVLATLKSIVNSGASVAGRPVTIPQLLSGPVDLVGDSLAAGLLANPRPWSRRSSPRCRKPASLAAWTCRAST